MLAHTFTALTGKYGVSAAYAAFPDKISAKGKPLLQQCTEIRCKDTKYLLYTLYDKGKNDFFMKFFSKLSTFQPILLPPP